MKLSARQAQLLLIVLQESINIKGYFSISSEERLKLLNQILDQQDRVLKKLGD